MEKKLFLIDAYALIYRAFFAFSKRPLINSKGVNTSPMVGFVRVLDEIIAKEQPTHIAVAFDGNVRPFRFKIFDQYKAQREKTPEDILVAIPVIKDILKAYNIPILELNHSPYDTDDQNYSYEADDIIGTMSHLAEQAGFDVYMLTPDKDYAQLVRERVKMYRPNSKNGGYDIIGLEQLKENWKISSPQQMIDYLALVGDSSDNIPGCTGVGPVTANTLLEEYGDVENIIKNVDNLKGKLKEKVQTCVDQIRLSYTLAKICLDAPIEFNEEQLLRKPENKPELLKIFNEYEMRALFKEHGGELSSNPAKSSAPKVGQQLSLFDDFPTNESEEIIHANLSDLNSTKHNYKLIENEKEIDEFVAILSATDFFCFDTETTGINTFSAELVGMSFSWKENEANFVYLPNDRVECQKIVDKFKPIFENSSIVKIGQNMKFDILMLSHYGVQVNGKLCDTMIAHYLLQPELKHNMDYMAETLLHYKTVTYEEMTSTSASKNLNIRLVDHQRLSDYACEDADITLQLWHKLQPELKNNGLTSLFEDVEMPLVSVLVNMELNGATVDVEQLSKLSVSLNEQLSNIEQEIYKLAGYEFNISSPRQVGELIYDVLKLDDKPKKTKTGQYSTTEAVLETFKGKNEIIDKILDYRALKKLLSTYIESLPKMVNPTTGRIHTSYNQTVTSTGRLSSSDPNLQNIPVRDEMGKDIRKAFVAEEGCVFVSADYSQIELRVMAHLSQDPSMLEAFQKGFDVHAATAAKIYGVPLKEVTKDMRRKAKTANFGIIYGISAFGLSQRLQISRDEAKQLIDGYFEQYPKVKEFIESSISKARETGYAETMLHRKRYLSDINSRNGNIRAFAERNAVNAPIQGTAADIIKIAMINVLNEFKANNLKSKLTMQVHDELNFSVYPDELEKVKSIVKEQMENAMHLSVPLDVECGVGENWLEAH
ncbi:MAG: DNA polymerase I [Paludibacteraceae bacterium]|nr:DNA polymerase I [Paludibacteraceae bacterium]